MPSLLAGWPRFQDDNHVNYNFRRLHMNLKLAAVAIMALQSCSVAAFTVARSGGVAVSPRWPPADGYRRLASSPASPPRTVFVCTDKACEMQGAFAALAALRDRGVPAREMGCPGRCGLGPVVGVEEGECFDLVERADADSETLEQVARGGVAPTALGHAR